MAKRILYVEDYPVIQTIYIEALKKRDFEVDVVGDGQEALEKVEDSKQPYDLILLDLLLPQLSGIEFLKKYRSLDKAKQGHTKIAVLTDFDSPATVKQVRDLRIDIYWLKAENVPSLVAQNIAKLFG